MLPTTCDGSGTTEKQSRSHSTYACYAIRADIYGWMRTLMEVLSLASLVWITLQVTARDAGEMLQRLRMKRARADFINFDPKAKTVKPTHPEPTAKPPQDSDVSRLDKAMRQLPEEPQPPRSGPRPLPPEGSTTPTKQAAALKTNGDRKAPKRGLHNAGVVSYAGIRDAEIYLDSIFSLYTKDTARLGRKRLLHLFGGRIHIYVPRFRHQRNLQSICYTRCVWTTMKSTWINKPPRDLRWRLALHMAALGQHPPWRWPRFLHHMCQINETREPPHWHLLAIASDAQLSQIPLTIIPKVWTFMAIENLLIIIALIVQVELTITWNHIRGLQNLNTLGQLIPFILGVGGLLKVLWGKGCMVWKGIKEDPKENGRHRGNYEAAIERYLKWKEEVEKGDKGPGSGSEMTGTSV